MQKIPLNCLYTCPQLHNQHCESKFTRKQRTNVFVRPKPPHAGEETCNLDFIAPEQVNCPPCFFFFFLTEHSGIGKPYEMILHLYNSLRTFSPASQASVSKETRAHACRQTNTHTYFTSIVSQRVVSRPSSSSSCVFNFAKHLSCLFKLCTSTRTPLTRDDIQNLTKCHG